jgi:hypothetical protein
MLFARQNASETNHTPDVTTFPVAIGILWMIFDVPASAVDALRDMANALEGMKGNSDFSRLDTSVDIG